MAVKKNTTKASGKKEFAPTKFVCSINLDAREVFLAGDFNGWNPSADRMLKQSGSFVKQLKLPPGEYQYKFVVDGEWHIDPLAEIQAPNEFGTMNSVIRV